MKPFHALILAGATLVPFAFCAGVLRAIEVPPAVLQAEAAQTEAIARASAATLAVFGDSGQGGGSGVVISPDGFALTNFHVAQPCGTFMRCGMSDGKLYDAVIVGLDPTGDVALIKLFGRTDFPVAEMGDSDRCRVGDTCFVIGNPFLLATNLQPSVSHGIISGVHRYQYPAGTILEYADCLQTDAAINPGNSGGPLFNAQGQLIGINGRGSFEKRGRVNVGVGYAISINQIKYFLGHLHSGRIVDHATLGATLFSDEAGRPLVSQILRTSDAYRRGLREGDELIAFGGRDIESVNGFKNALGIYPKGWEVPLSFRRDGERHDIVVRLTGVHTAEELLEKIQDAPAPPDPGTPPKDGDKDRKPAPAPRVPPPAPKVEPSAELKAHFEERKGFANFYFNRLHRERVASAFRQYGDFTTLDGPWTLRGTSPAGDVTFELGNATSEGTFAGQAVELDLHKDLESQLGPPGSGGMLLALHLWRRFLQQGVQEYGDVYYFGDAPVLGQDKRYDVLLGTFDVTETRFLFDPVSGELARMEVFPDAGVDPCILEFHNYQSIDASRRVPHRMIVRHGSSVFTELTWSSLTAAEK